MTNRPILAVDFDDVIGGFNAAFIPYINGVLGTTFTFEQVTDFQLQNILGISAEAVLRHFEIFTHQHHDTILPIAGVDGALGALHEYFELQYVTSRCESARAITDEWLEAFELRELFTAGHFTNGVSRKYPKRRVKKSFICQQIHAVGLIDDALHNAHDVAACNIHTFLFDQPWNQTGELPLSVTRVYTWPEITELLIPHPTTP